MYSGPSKSINLRNNGSLAPMRFSRELWKFISNIIYPNNEYKEIYEKISLDELIKKFSSTNKKYSESTIAHVKNVYIYAHKEKTDKHITYVELREKISKISDYFDNEYFLPWLYKGMEELKNFDPKLYNKDNEFRKIENAKYKENNGSSTKNIREKMKNILNSKKSGLGNEFMTACNGNNDDDPGYTSEEIPSKLSEIAWQMWDNDGPISGKMEIKDVEQNISSAYQSLSMN